MATADLSISLEFDEGGFSIRRFPYSLSFSRLNDIQSVVTVLFSSILWYADSDENGFSRDRPGSAGPTEHGSENPHPNLYVQLSFSWRKLQRQSSSSNKGS